MSCNINRGLVIGESGAKQCHPAQGGTMRLTVDEALARGGAGRFQGRLLGIFGLVWAADAMQVVAVGFAAPSIAAQFGLGVAQAAQQTGTLFFLGMFITINFVILYAIEKGMSVSLSRYLVSIMNALRLV